MRSPKISPAFEPFLADSSPEDKRDAIVVYQADGAAALSPRRRLAVLKQRLDFVKATATSQHRVVNKGVQEYLVEATKRMKRSTEFATQSIGKSALPVAAVEVTRRTLPALAEQPNVVAVMPNQKIRLILPQRVDYGELGKAEEKEGLTWGLQALEIETAWKKTKGKGVNVAVLDTGVYAEHPALAGRISKHVIIDPLGRRIVPDKMFDAGNHGTHVCGTIAGGKADKVSIGVAPEASLMVAGALVGECTLRTLVEAISWAVENGADVINMSLGFTYYEPLFAEVLKAVIGYGIVPVVAIGNENHGNSSCPGNVENAFSVGAVEKLPGGSHDIAFFSSGASLTFPQAGHVVRIDKPDVAAPGSQVYSSIPPDDQPNGTYLFTYMNGTSMATPHASGVAALLMAHKPAAPVEDIIRVLKETAKHPTGLRPDNRWGFGMIQPAAALAAL